MKMFKVFAGIPAAVCLCLFVSGCDASMASAWKEEIDLSMWEMLNKVEEINQRNRNLQTVFRPCNAEITRTTRDDLISALNLQLNFFFNASYATTVSASIASAMKYDVASYKICGSCQELFGDMTDPPYYCAPDVYGYDALESSLLFLPILDANDASSLPIEGSLRGLVGFHGARFNAQQPATELWPTNLTAIVESVIPTDFVSMLVYFANYYDSLPGAIMASGGAAAVYADAVGYANSMTTHNRTFFVPIQYQQAAMVSAYTTQEFLANLTGGCTVLSPVVTTTGGSEGGFATVIGSKALEDSGFTVIKNYACSPLLDVDVQTSFIVQSYDEGLVNSPVKNNQFFSVIMAYLAFSYSANTPGLANTGTDQLFVSPAYNVPANTTNNVIDWFKSPNPLYYGQYTLPTYGPDLWNPSWVTLIKNAVAVNQTRPCYNATTSTLMTDGIDKLCAAVIAASVYSVFDQIKTTTDLCYGPDDTILPVTMFPDSLFLKANVNKVNSVLGLPTNYDHIFNIVFCTFRLFDSMVPANIVSDSSNPVLISPLEGQDFATCHKCSLTKGSCTTKKNCCDTTNGCYGTSKTNMQCLKCAKKNMNCKKPTDCCKGGIKYTCTKKKCVKCSKSGKKCSKPSSCCSGKCVKSKCK